jgi:hypothetical protein
MQLEATIPSLRSRGIQILAALTSGVSFESCSTLWTSRQPEAAGVKRCQWSSMGIELPSGFYQKELTEVDIDLSTFSPNDFRFDFGHAF